MKNTPVLGCETCAFMWDLSIRKWLAHSGDFVSPMVCADIHQRIWNIGILHSFAASRGLHDKILWYHDNVELHTITCYIFYWFWTFLLILNRINHNLFKVRIGLHMNLNIRNMYNVRQYGSMQLPNSHHERFISVKTRPPQVSEKSSKFLPGIIKGSQ